MTWGGSCIHGLVHWWIGEWGEEKDNVRPLKEPFDTICLVCLHCTKVSRSIPLRLLQRSFNTRLNNFNSPNNHIGFQFLRNGTRSTLRVRPCLASSIGEASSLPHVRPDRAQ